jgi:putative transposase
MAMYFSEEQPAPTHLLKDGDTKLGAHFNAILESEGILVKRVSPYAPNLNAFAERWVQSIKKECLDHFIVFGEAHLHHLVDEYVSYYNSQRPHQALGNNTLDAPDPPLPSIPIKSTQVACQQRLGGLLRHYYRRAA